MYRALPLIVVVGLLVAGVLFWLVISPALARRRERQRLRDARMNAIEAKQHEWDLENMDMTRDELRRHKARLEGNLDDLHRQQ